MAVCETGSRVGCDGPAISRGCVRRTAQHRSGRSPERFVAMLQVSCRRVCCRNSGRCGLGPSRGHPCLMFSRMSQLGASAVLYRLSLFISRFSLARFRIERIKSYLCDFGSKLRRAFQCVFMREESCCRRPKPRLCVRLHPRDCASRTGSKSLEGFC